MKNMLLVLVLTISQSSFGAEIKSAHLESLQDIGVVTAPKGCTQEAKGFLGIKTENQVDCYGVIIRGATGKNQLGIKVSLGDILIFPVGLDRADADAVVQTLIAKMNNQLPKNTTIVLSPIRYIEKEFALSGITNDRSDSAMVKLGGVTISYPHAVQRNGNTSLTSDTSFSLGLQ